MREDGGGEVGGDRGEVGRRRVGAGSVFVVVVVVVVPMRSVRRRVAIVMTPAFGWWLW